MTIYREWRFWSPVLGCEAARLSMVDGGNREFFAVVSTEDGRRWRQRREQALDAIEAAIRSGEEPGEVFVERGGAFG